MFKAIPALPVRNIRTATNFYRAKYGFAVHHEDDQFAIVGRDDVELHLWAAADDNWKWKQGHLIEAPITSGAESFLAGTASCRIQVKDIESLFNEYRKQEVLYDQNTRIKAMPWGTLEFPTLDSERNLLTFFATDS